MNISHPLENVFDLDSGTTLATQPSVQLPIVPVAPAANYDDKDKSIEEQLQEVQHQAMELAAAMKLNIEYAEPRSQARLGEVSIQALNTALDAIKQKADIKKHKDKISTTGGLDSFSSTVNNTMIVDRAALLDRLLAGQK